MTMASSTRLLAVASAALLGLTVAAQQPAPPPGASASFTAEQAQAGREAYTRECASCHRPAEMPDQSRNAEREEPEEQRNIVAHDFLREVAQLAPGGDGLVRPLVGGIEKAKALRLDVAVKKLLVMRAEEIHGRKDRDENAEREERTNWICKPCARSVWNVS